MVLGVLTWRVLLYHLQSISESLIYLKHVQYSSATARVEVVAAQCVRYMLLATGS
jgi:hypothetical protein